MTDKIYVGALVSSEVLEHSSGPWKKHGYVKKTQESGYTRYWYPEDIKKNNRKAGGKNPSEEDIKNAEEAYKQAAEEYSAAKKAYDANPTEENKAKLSAAGMKLEAAGTGQLDQWYKDGKPVISDENADMYLTRSGARMNARKPISRKKNVISGSARIDASEKRRSGESYSAALSGKINKQQNSLINMRRKGLIGSDTYHKLLSASDAFNSKRYEAYKREEGAKKHKRK